MGSKRVQSILGEAITTHNYHQYRYSQKHSRWSMVDDKPDEEDNIIDDGTTDGSSFAETVESSRSQDEQSGNGHERGTYSSNLRGENKRGRAMNINIVTKGHSAAERPAKQLTKKGGRNAHALEKVEAEESTLADKLGCCEAMLMQ